MPEFVPKQNKVFVKNLSSDTTSQIQDFFGNLAPIRRCFVVQKDGKCTGTGYVHYALEQDAKKAVATLNRKTLKGKSIEVSIAKPRQDKSAKNENASEAKIKKERIDNEQSEEIEKKEQPKKKTMKASDKQEEDDGEDKDIGTQVDITKPTIARRTVVLSDIPQDIVYKQILRKVRKFGKIEALEFPSAESQTSAYVLYSGADQAAASLIKLPGLKFGANSSIKSRMFSTTGTNHYRVIIRNLPFKGCTADQIKELFSKFGDILQIDLPAGETPGKIRGFGFVTYTNMASAEKAANEGSRLKLAGRQLAVDITVGRRELQQSKRNDQSMDVDSNDSDVQDHSASQPDNEASEDGNPDEQEEEEEVQFPNGVPSFETEDEEEDDEEANKKSKKKDYSTDVHLGKTLFLRNVAFDTTDEDLMEKFAEWGPIQHAKIVTDRSTGEPKGTAFVHFIDPNDAKKCLKDAYRSSTFSTQKKYSQQQSSTLKESDIQLGGRKLIIDVALARKTADNLAEEKKAKRAVADPRNMSLAQLSTLSQEDMAALTKDERVKYERGQHEKNAKLANPNYHVSRTRLCVRNLPKSTTEDDLKALFKEAASGAPGHVGFHQIKVVRDKEKSNTSRGFAFVEFTDHVHALEAQKVIHNKQHRSVGNRKLFVEFAVEDRRLLMAREIRLQKSKERSQSLQQQANARSPKSNDRNQDKPAKRDRQPETKKRKRSDSSSSIGPILDLPSKRRKLDENSSKSKYKASDEQMDRIAKNSMEIDGQNAVKLKKGKWNEPNTHGRRSNKTLAQNKQERALEKLIGEYQTSLGSNSGRRWFE